MNRKDARIADICAVYRDVPNNPDEISLSVGAHSDHQVTFLFEGLIPFEDPAVELLFPILCDQVPGCSIANRHRALRGDRDTIPAHDECCQVIQSRPFSANGEEEAELATMPREWLAPFCGIPGLDLRRHIVAG